MKNEFAIYGASGHAKVIIEMLEESGFLIKGLYDDDSAKKLLFEYEIFHEKSFLQLPGIKWIIGIGNNETRKRIAVSNLLNYETVIDKSTIISKRSQLGKGTVIMPGSTINSSVNIGDHVIINTNASIDHDCILNDYVHVSPNATLCGGVVVGEGTHIGAGAIIIPGITIGKWCIIGAGSVIIRDIPDNMKVVGNPGRRIDY